MKKSIIKITAILLMVAGSFVSCNEKESAVSIADLHGTKWKLVGMVDINTGKLSVLEADSEDSFTIRFERNTIHGYSIYNSFSGILQINNKTGDINISNFIDSRVGEPRAGSLFLQAVRSMQNITLKQNELRIFSAYTNKEWPAGFYDIINNSYLLFKLQEQ